MQTDTPTHAVRTGDGQIIVTDANTPAGAVVYWERSGVVNYVKLCRAWSAADLPPEWLPRLPSPNTAIRRALKEYGKGSRSVHRLKGGTKGWALVDNSIEGEAQPGTPWGTVELRAELDSDSDEPQVKLTPEDHPLHAGLNAAFTKYLANLGKDDVSGWLADLMGHLRAVSLRSSGGFYFVPKHRVDTLRAIASVLRACGDTRIFELPALASDNAVEAVLEAVTREAQDEAGRLRDDLAKAATGEVKLGERALKTKARQCKAVADKVGAYTELLGTGLDALQQQLTELHANITVAILTAGSDEKAAA